MILIYPICWTEFQLLHEQTVEDGLWLTWIHHRENQDLHDECAGF